MAEAKSKWEESLSELFTKGQVELDINVGNVAVTIKSLSTDEEINALEMLPNTAAPIAQMALLKKFILMRAITKVNGDAVSDPTKLFDLLGRLPGCSLDMLYNGYLSAAAVVRTSLEKLTEEGGVDHFFQQEPSQ